MGLIWILILNKNFKMVFRKYYELEQSHDI